jgi:hypothetical protein
MSKKNATPDTHLRNSKVCQVKIHYFGFKSLANGVKQPDLILMPTPELVLKFMDSLSNLKCLNEFIKEE